MEDQDQINPDTGIPFAEEPIRSPEVPAGSLLEQLKKGRERAANEQTRDFPLPNNGGVLRMEAKLLPWTRLEQVTQQVEAAKSDDDRIAAAASAIGAACVGVFLQDPASGERQPWPGGQESLPFGPELWDLLRGSIPPLPESARRADYVRVVLAPPTVDGVSREASIVNFWTMLVMWMSDAGEEVNRDYAEG